MNTENQQILDRTAEIVKARSGNGTYCSLVLADTDGYPVASVITAAWADGLNEVAFATGLESTRTARIRRDPRTSVHYAADDYSITLTGRIEIRTDAKTLSRAWYDGLSHHFTGPDDPAFCVLVLRVERYSLFVNWQEVTGTI